MTEISEIAHCLRPDTLWCFGGWICLFLSTFYLKVEANPASKMWVLPWDDDWSKIFVCPYKFFIGMLWVSIITWGNKRNFPLGTWYTLRCLR